MRTVAMLLLPMIVLRVLIVHAVGELVLGVGPVVVIMIAVLVLPADLLVVAFHGPMEVLEGVRVTVATPVTVSVYVTTPFVT